MPSTPRKGFGTSKCGSWEIPGNSPVVFAFGGSDNDATGESGGDLCGRRDSSVSSGESLRASNVFVWTG